jgi:hypothetical protein
MRFESGEGSQRHWLLYAFIARALLHVRRHKLAMDRTLNDCFFKVCLLTFLIFLSIVSSQIVHAQNAAFSFGVITHSRDSPPDQTIFKQAINTTDADNLAFVVAQGIKSYLEPCTDSVFLQYKDLLQSAKNGLILSMTASDWSACQTASGQNVAVERLNRIRDLFFDSDFSFGASKLPLIRQAKTPKFRAYMENVRWDVGSIVFATINLPANNNNYVVAAGRNSEFEDRSFANRDWLHRVFSMAKLKGAAGVILFCDGNPFQTNSTGQTFNTVGKRDGFVEIRKQLIKLGARFTGQVLIIYGANGATKNLPDGIVWQNNIGTVATSSEWLKVNVDPVNTALFTLDSQPLRAERNTK